MILLTITTLAIPYLVLVMAVALLKPSWLIGSWRWLSRLVYASVVLTGVLVLVDFTYGTQILYSAVGPETILSGFTASIGYTHEVFSPTMKFVTLVLIPSASLLLTLYLSLFDNKLSTAKRKLAWLLFGAQAITLLANFLIPYYHFPVIWHIISSIVWALFFTYIAFDHILSERRSQRSFLRGRLTTLILIVTLPILIAINLLITSYARHALTQYSLENLRTVHQAISTSIRQWQYSQIYNLDLINELVQAHFSEENGIAYVVNDNNQVVIHSDPKIAGNQLDLSEYSPIITIRNETSTLGSSPDGDLQTTAISFSFMDEKGVKWQAYGSILDDDWGLVVQITENELFTSIRQIERLSWTAITIGLVMTLMLIILTVRRELQPIDSITDASIAITEGDLTRAAPINLDGEFGIIARTINNITNRIRELNINIESKVAERTWDLEQRFDKLLNAVMVTSETTAVHDQKRLLSHTVNQISDRFEYEHVRIFLMSPSGEYAILRAASSEIWQRMLANGYKFKIGQSNIVSYVVENGKARIADHASEDAIYKDEPDLPRPCSEIVLPLTIQQDVIGVLDIQSTKATAFTQDDIPIFQILANQIAKALDISQRLTDGEQAFQDIEKLYKREIGQEWEKRLSNQKIAYIYNQHGVQEVSQSPLHLIEDGEDPRVLKLSLNFHGQSFGSITLRRKSDQPPLSSNDIQLVKTTVSQIVLALENARLIEELCRRAQNEQVLSQISASTQSSRDVETIMKRAVKEIGQSIGAAKVQIRLGNGNQNLHQKASPDLLSESRRKSHV